MEYILFVSIAMLVYLFGAVHGWHLRERHARRVMEHVSRAVREHIESEVENLTHIVIEKHNDTLYVYEKDTMTFMAQGDTKDAIEETLKSKYPGKRFACSEKTLIDIGFLS
jgi:hypothetical protein